MQELVGDLTRYGKLSAKSEREQSQVSEDAVAYPPSPTQTGSPPVLRGWPSFVPRGPAPEFPGLFVRDGHEQVALRNFHKIFPIYTLNSIIINTLHIVDKFFLFIPPISLYS